MLFIKFSGWFYEGKTKIPINFNFLAIIYQPTGIGVLTCSYLWVTVTFEVSNSDLRMVIS